MLYRREKNRIAARDSRARKVACLNNLEQDITAMKVILTSIIKHWVFYIPRVPEAIVSNVQSNYDKRWGKKDA
jgi:hypothetical protein